METESRRFAGEHPEQQAWGSLPTTHRGHVQLCGLGGPALKTGHVAHARVPLVDNPHNDLNPGVGHVPQKGNPGV